MRGGINPAFAAANAPGRGGLQEAGGGAVEARLARGRESGVVDLTGLELATVPASVWAIFDAAPPQAAPPPSASFDGGGDKWWENVRSNPPLPVPGRVRSW